MVMEVSERRYEGERVAMGRCIRLFLFFLLSFREEMKREGGARKKASRCQQNQIVWSWAY